MVCLLNDHILMILVNELIHLITLLSEVSLVRTQSEDERKGEELPPSEIEAILAAIRQQPKKKAEVAAKIELK